MGKKILTLVIIFSLFSIVGFSFFGKKECPKKKEEPTKFETADARKTAEAAAKDSKDGLNHKVLAFNLEGFTQKGTKSWEVNGQSAEAITETQVRLDNIVAKAYGDEAEAVITADKGVYDKTKNNVTLRNNVKATIDSTKGFGEQFTGIAGQASDDPKSEKADAKGGKKRSKIIITCEGEVEFNYEKNQAYFVKTVKVVSEDGNIEADKITVNLEPNTKKIKNIVAEGNVKITQGENITYSDKALYIEKDKKIVLVGRPKLIIYDESGDNSGFMNTIKGDTKKK